MKYNLSYNTWNKKEINAASKILSSGNYTMGKTVKKFEKLFAKKLGSKYAIMVNSGSSANLLMMTALRYFPNFLKKKNIKKPNIIVPSIGWSTSYFPISQNNFKIKFVDVDLNTLNIDISKLTKAIDKNTVAILAINLLGNPCEYEKLIRISNQYKLVLLEDNCESLGSKYKNRYSGTIGLMGSHSLFFSHHIQTMEGGVILTNNTDLNHILRSLRAHGWSRELPNRNNLYKKNRNDFDDKFKFITPGYCVRPLEIEAAIGIVQLKKLNSFLSIRKKNALTFRKLFSNKDWCTIQSVNKSSVSSWYGFNIILKGILKNKRKKIIDKLTKSKIESRPTMTGNFLKNPVIKFLDHYAVGNFKNSEYIDKNGFFVGNYPKNLNKELNTLYKKIKEVID